MTDRSADEPRATRDTAVQYRKLLRGEITSQQYVKAVREVVSSSRKSGRASTRSVGHKRVGDAPA